MNKTKLIEAENLKHGDILSWSNGHYDTIEAVTSNRNGDIMVLCNNYTATMYFLPSDLLRIVKHD